MKRILLCSIVLLIKTFSLAAQTKAEVLTNKSVIEMYKAGLDGETVVSKISSSDCRFDLTSAGLIALKKQGLTKDIINAMMGKTGAAQTQKVKVQPASLNTYEASQTSSKAGQIPDLEFINVLHYYDKSGNTIRLLERSTVAVKAKVNILKAMVPGTSTPIVFKMDSAASKVRLPLQETISFMVNTGANVPEIFGMYRMKAGKNKREATWFDVSAFENKSDRDVIAFNYRKMKDGVYEIVPTIKLEKGEYCFVNKASYGTYGGAKADVFAFGVD